MGPHRPQSASATQSPYNHFKSDLFYDDLCFNLSENYLFWEIYNLPLRLVKSNKYFNQIKFQTKTLSWSNMMFLSSYQHKFLEVIEPAKNGVGKKRKFNKTEIISINICEIPYVNGADKGCSIVS